MRLVNRRADKAIGGRFGKLCAKAEYYCQQHLERKQARTGQHEAERTGEIGIITGIKWISKDNGYLWSIR